MATSLCQVCPWESLDWPTTDEAGCDATWHVYRKHPDVWRSLFGDNPPTDPNPRQPLADHPHFDPEDGRVECPTCGKWVHLVIHSCKGVPVTAVAIARAQSKGI